MATKQLMLHHSSPLDLDKYLLVWDWTFWCPDVPSVPPFKMSEHVFRELWICRFIVVWGGALPEGM